MKSLTIPDGPLFDGYFADPFVLRVEEEGAYYAFGTGSQPNKEDKRRFPVLRSDDFIHWEYLGGR